MRQSVKPQIPFCTKREVVALIIYRLERVCATPFLRPKAVGRVGFKSDFPIDGYHRQMVNRIFSPTLPQYRPARWARWRGGSGRLGGIGNPKGFAVGVGRGRIGCKCRDLKGGSWAVCARVLGGWDCVRVWSLVVCKETRNALWGAWWLVSFGKLVRLSGGGCFGVDYCT